MKKNIITGNRGGLARDNTRPTYDFSSIINPERNISEMFFELTRCLGERFHINRGVLILKRAGTNDLAAVSTWNNGRVREGLTISLPKVSSLFEKVAEDGRVYTEDYCGAFSGNFFEQKLLLDDDSRSFVLHPLKSDGEVIGLLGYSSEQPTAFAVFEEGVLEDISNKLAAVIAAKVYRDF
ncbi:MAG: GAF domain-containing protein [candidate division Zixibacteria bacterium]|nr:GAF domain-containing protein [candidate division Zixibacteria bacterium]